MVSILIIAVIAESLAETIVSLFPKLKAKYISLAVSILICTLSKTSILTFLNISCSFAFADYILTGILVSRGSNFLHDFLRLLENWKIKITE